MNNINMFNETQKIPMINGVNSGSNIDILNKLILINNDMNLQYCKFIADAQYIKELQLKNETDINDLKKTTTAMNESIKKILDKLCQYDIEDDKSDIYKNGEDQEYDHSNEQINSKFQNMFMNIMPHSAINSKSIFIHDFTFDNKIEELNNIMMNQNDNNELEEMQNIILNRIEKNKIEEIQDNELLNKIEHAEKKIEEIHTVVINQTEENKIDEIPDVVILNEIENGENIPSQKKSKNKNGEIHESNNDVREKTKHRRKKINFH